MAIKNIRTFDKLATTPYDISLNKAIQKAIDKGKIHPIKPNSTIKKPN